MTKHLPGADFIRALCTLGVVTYHFSCTLVYYGNSDFRFLYRFANGNCGLVFVTMFFMLSGALLYRNNSDISSYKTFYIKRWKSIFPMFYIAFLIFYIPTAIKFHSPLYLGRPWSLLLTFFGIDGYFLYKIPSYYLLGEWFLGAIILLYIIYPLLLKLLSKPLMTTVIIICLHIWQVYSDLFVIHDFSNLISCLISFWLGILFMKYYDNIINILNKRTVTLLIAALLPLIFVNIKPVPDNFIIHITGYILFILLFSFGNFAMNNKIINKSCSLISYLSYAVFLLHHQILYKLLIKFTHLNFISSVILLLITYVLCIVSSLILTKLCNYITAFVFGLRKSKKA